MKIIHKVILTSFLFCAVLLPIKQANAGVCQNKTAIVYSNGMFSDRDQADASREMLSIEMHLKLAGSQLLNELEIDDLAYASDGSQFQFGGTNPIIGLINKAIQLANGAGQITEVILQKILQDDYSAFWRWLAGIQPAGSTLQNLLNQAAAGANSISYIFDPDLQKQVALYSQAC